MSCFSYLFQIVELFFSPSSNDLAWDGESKRIIAVGDGKEKSVHSYSDFGAMRYQTHFVLLRLGLATLFLWIRVLRLERFWDIQK